MERLAKELTDLKELYGVTDKEIELYRLILDNLNSKVGYDYYYELCKSIKDNNLPDDILYDISPEFKWDNKLDEEFKIRAIKDNRLDLI